MVHSNHAVWGAFEEQIRWYKSPPAMAITEHWNYSDEGKDFHGGYLFGSQGPLIQDWAMTNAAVRGMWGMELRKELTRHNHMADSGAGPQSGTEHPSFVGEASERARRESLG
jgi:hypothetical protein